MDTGWVIYGVLLIVGACLAFDVRKGPHAIGLVALAIVAGIGVALVGLVQGSNANVANGLIVFHTSGAQAVMLAGNLMAIAVGVNGSRIGLSRARAITSVVLGTVGLIAFGAFMADALTGRMWNIGLLERSVIYPIMIGHVLLGAGLIAAARTRATHQAGAPAERVAS